MPSHPDPKAIADAIKSSESAFSQSHIQNPLLQFTVSQTVEVPPCKHDGPNTPIRQSTHRTGVPLMYAGKVKEQLELELFDGPKDKGLREAPSAPAELCRTMADETRLTKYLKKTQLYDTLAKRWTNMPATGPEAGLYEPFTKIINDILKDSRVPYATAHDTHKVALTSLEEHQIKFVDEKDREVNGKTSPDICIMGDGKRFRDKNKNGKLSYSQCIVPVELKTESMLASIGLRAVVLQIAVYIRQCFNHQPNRRYACAILATETNLRLMVFERTGGMQTGAFDFHKEPEAFVRVILGISTIRDKNFSCFDSAIRWLPCTSCKTQYLILELPSCAEVARDDRPRRNLQVLLNGKPFARRAICGRGTRCWQGVIIEGKDRIAVVVKESWRSKGREPEWALLKRVATFDGVGKLLFYCDDEKDTVSRFRSLIFGDSVSCDIDRTFSRVILEAYGPPIHYFDSPLQLLQALRDAVAGHKFMWEEGILHRDISIHNILLGKENATDGNRGVLIDLDMAIDIKKYKKNAESRTGTRAFQSIMVVSPFVPGQIRPPQDHLDDLESFFYVLMWICILFVAPQKITASDRGSHVNAMEHPIDRTSVVTKRDLLNKPTKSFSRWFAKSSTFCTLSKDLGSFLDSAVDAKDAIVDEYKDTPTVQFPTLEQVHETAGTGDHDVFIGHLDKAIAELQSDLSAGPDPLQYLQHTEPFVPLDKDGVNPPSGPSAANIVIDSDTGPGTRGKRAASDGRNASGAQKRARDDGVVDTNAEDDIGSDNDSADATDGVARLQLSDGGK